MTIAIQFQGAVKKLVNHICTNTGAVNKEIVINFPVTGTQQVLLHAFTICGEGEKYHHLHI